MHACQIRQIQLNRTNPDPDGAEGHNNLNSTERCCSMSSSDKLWENGTVANNSLRKMMIR